MRLPIKLLPKVIDLCSSKGGKFSDILHTDVGFLKRKAVALLRPTKKIIQVDDHFSFVGAYIANEFTLEKETELTMTQDGLKAKVTWCKGVLQKEGGVQRMHVW